MLINSIDENAKRSNIENPMNDPLFLQQALNSAPGLTAIVRGTDLKIVYINSSFEHFLGYTNKELDENEIYFSQLIEPHQADRLHHQINLAKEFFVRKCTYVIYPLTNKKGETASFYLYVSPVVGVDAEYGLYYNILLQPDLSEWSIPFTSFVTRELFLEQFQNENFGTIEWLVDIDKAFWSHGIYKIFEVDESYHDLNFSFMLSHVHYSDQQRVNEAVEIAKIDGSKIDIEFRIITTNSVVKSLHCLAKAIKDSRGTVVKIAGSLRDITTQRNIEEELKSKVEELYHSNKELEEFAFIASHDMQEPLRKIITFSSMLQDKYKTALAGDGAMYLSRMTFAAENMRMLINDVLEFSRISKTKQAFEPVDLNVTLRIAISDLELAIEETNAVIKYDLLPEISAIPSQMKQLFLNIISNSIKFRKSQQAPEITIVSTELSTKLKLYHDLPANKKYYEIVITDNGIGFDEEYADKIFKVFQRLHGKSEYPGSGIGLAICKKILEHHNGIIYAENLPGKGARFTIIIPQIQEIAAYEPGK